MTAIPAAIAAQTAITQQSIALAVVKQNAQADQAIVGILQQAVESAPASGSRGSNVNIAV